MRGTVIVVFPRDREYELRLTAGDKPLPTAQEGDQWLSQQFEELGCTPRSLVGKVLVLDKVLEVSRARRARNASPATSPGPSVTPAPCSLPSIAKTCASTSRRTP